MSPGECIASGKIKFLSGFTFSICSVSDLVVPPKASERSSVIVFELPEDVIAAWTFSMKKGERIQLTLPEKGYDDQYFTFNGRWMAYNTTVNIPSVSVRFGAEFETKANTLDLFGDSATFDMKYKEGIENLEITGRFVANRNGKLSQEISREFYNQVQRRKSLFELKERIRKESLSETEDVLRRQQASYDRESVNLKDIEKQIVNITSQLKLQEGVVQNAKQKVQQAFTTNTTTGDFQTKCLNGPNYCPGYCLSSMNVVECVPDKKRVIFFVDYNCGSRQIIRNRVRFKTPTKRNVSFTGSEMKAECFNECPTLVRQGQQVSVLSRDFDQFGHCYRFCRETPVPIRRFREVIENHRHSESYNQTVLKCSNNFRQKEAPIGAPYEQEQMVCFKPQFCTLDINQNCRARVSDCILRAKVMSAADINFKNAFDMHTREVNRQDVLEIQKQILDATLKWQTNVKVFLNDVIKETREQISELARKDDKTWESNKLSKYSNTDSLQLTEISFNYNFLKGSTPPSYIPLKIRTKDPRGDIRPPVVVLANVHQKDESIYNVAKALIDYNVSSNCFDVENSAVYLTNFVVNVEKLVTEYQQNQVQYNINANKIKESNSQLLQQIKDYQKNFGGETIGELKNVEQLLNNYLIPPYRQWNETFTTFLTKLRSESRDEDLCHSFDHCVEFHIKRIQDFLRFKNNSRELANKIRLNYEELEQIFPRFLHANLGVSEVKLMAKDVYNKMLSPDPVAMFCGAEPIIENQINGDIKVKEGESLRISVKITNEEFDYTISWKRDEQFLPGYSETTFQKIATAKDEGWYSCIIRNRFGVTDCGVLKVEVILKPVFHPPHHAVTVYKKSPRALQYLVCNASNSEEVQWFRHSFSDPSQINTLSVSNNQFWLHASLNKALQSGIYWCEVQNDNLNAVNQKVRFHRDSVQMAINQIEISFSLKVKLARRRRRDNALRQKRQIPTTISPFDKDNLQVILSTIMSVSDKDIKNLKYTKEDPTARIKFTMEGKDFSKELSDSSNWDDLTEKIINARKQLLSQIVLLESKKSPIAITLENEQNLELVPGSIQISQSTMKCPTEGYGLTETGIVCGKFIFT